MKKKSPHRNIFVNDKLEFSVFYDTKITKKDKIIESCLKDKDYIWMSKYCSWKFIKADVSSNLESVYITVKVGENDGRQKD